MDTEKSPLTRLWSMGALRQIADGRESMDVWIATRTQRDMQEIAKRASAARAKTIRALNDQNSDESIEIEFELANMDFDGLIEVLVADYRTKRQAVIEAEYAAANAPWNENDYLQGLKDAWDDELMREYALDPNHPEAVRVLAELARFDADVAAELEQQCDAEAEGIRLAGEDVARDAVRRRLREAAYQAEWYRVFILTRAWRQVRDPHDHDKLMFASPDDLLDLSAPAFEAVMALVEAINLDPSLFVQLPEGVTSSD